MEHILTTQLIDSITRNIQKIQDTKRQQEYQKELKHCLTEQNETMFNIKLKYLNNVLMMLNNV